MKRTSIFGFLMVIGLAVPSLATETTICGVLAGGSKHGKTLRVENGTSSGDYIAINASQDAWVKIREVDTDSFNRIKKMSISSPLCLTGEVQAYEKDKDYDASDDVLGESDLTQEIVVTGANKVFGQYK